MAFTYDGALPLGETWTGPVLGAVTRTFSNNFDVASETVTGTAAVAFGYDADRLLTQAGALAITREAATGLVTHTSLGTTTDALIYNGFGESTRQTAQVGGADVFDVQITRDALGRITQRIEAVDGLTRVFTYGYDLAGRLATVRNGGTLVSQYTYDGNGNRLTALVSGLLVSSTYDAQDRLLTTGPTSYTYTANGERLTKTTSGQTTTYAYDTLGNLLTVTKPGGQVISYTVDGRGRRVRKAIDGVPVKGWLYADQLRPIAELDGAGTVVSRFVYGTKPNVPEYVIKSGETYRIVSDHLGTPRIVVHATTGVVVQRFDVQAFGEIIQDSAPGWQPFGFAGGLYDPDTGLLRFGARDYDPQVGRWTAKDPSNVHAGDSNLYAYVASQPLSWIDSNGRELVGAITGAAYGALGGYLGATAGGGDAGDKVLAAVVGAVIGAATGSLDPTGGVLTAMILAHSAINSGLGGALSNLVGQSLTNVRHHVPAGCINYGSVAGSFVGSAVGGAFSRVMGAAAATTELGQGTLGSWLTGTLQSAGLAPAFVGEQVGGAFAASGTR